VTVLKIHIDRYIRIPESEFLFLESGIQGFGIRILAQGFRNPVNDGLQKELTLFTIPAIFARA